MLKLSNMKKSISICALSLLITTIGCFAKTLAEDSVLQAIQINGKNNGYDIILKSNNDDNSAIIKKTIVSRNKMVIALEGINASQTINTIYNNTATVDSVVVEPSDNKIKIEIQAADVANATVKFGALKSAGRTDSINSTENDETATTQSKSGSASVMQNENTIHENLQEQKQEKQEILLSAPINTYRPVYERENEQDELDEILGTSVSLPTVLSSVKNVTTKIMHNEKSSWLVTIGLLIMLLSSIVSMLLKKKENTVKIGLGNHHNYQNMQQREIDMYRNYDMQEKINQSRLKNYAQNQNIQSQMPQSAMNYGLKAYQNTSKNPYTTSEIQSQRPVGLNSMKSSSANTMGVNSINNGGYTRKYSQSQMNTANTAQPNALQRAAQEIINKNNLNTATRASNAAKQSNTMAATISKPASMSASTPKTTQTSNIDSMKFLESMTRIYEKNGRSDLAQGLKNNIRKAQANIS